MSQPFTLTELCADGKAVLTVEELARLLRIGRNQAYEAIERGEVPGVLRLGHSIRLSVPTVQSWLGVDAEKRDLEEEIEFYKAELQLTKSERDRTRDG